MIKINNCDISEQINEGNKEEFSRTIFKLLIRGSELDLTKTVKRFNKTYPQEATTPQNISNKLSRDSLRVTEFFKLVSILGYNISFDNGLVESSQDVQTKTDIPETNSIAECSLSDLFVQGYSDCKSYHFSNVIIAGERADEASKWIEENLSDGLSETEEVMLWILANKKFGVKCKPIKK